MANWNDPQHCTSVSGRLSSLGPNATFRKIRVFALIVVFLITTSTFWAEAARSQTEVIDRILAVVNGQVIMKSDVQMFLTLQLVEIPPGVDQESQVLTYLIERRLVLDQIDRVVPQPASDLIEQQLQLMRGRFMRIEDFTEVLQQVGLTSDDLRQLLADDIRRDTYLANRFVSVREEIRAQAQSDWVADLARRGEVRLVSDLSH